MSHALYFKPVYLLLCLKDGTRIQSSYKNVTSIF